MLAWSRAQVDGLPFFGVVAASLLGMLLFLRVDMAIAVAGCGGAAALGRMAGLPPVVGFFPALVVGLAAAALYLLGLMKPYMAIPLVWIGALPAWQMAAGVLSAVAALAIVFGAAQLPAVRRLLPWVWRVLAAVAVALIVYAYFFRVAGGRLAEHDAIAVRSFAWYVLPLGLFTALVGYVAPQWGPTGPWIMASIYGVILGTYLVIRFSRGEWKAMETSVALPPKDRGQRRDVPSNEIDASTTVEVA
jgi:hypothetical protein